MLNFERLRVLHTVAVQGSVNAAADALHVTNSAVSQQLAKLERELGQSLLEPNGRGIRLTDAAALLVAHTRQILSLMEQAESQLDAQRDTIFGQITVAAFPTAIRGLAPRALQHLHDQHPQVRVMLNEQEPHEAVPLLVRGDIDVVIAQDWANTPLPQHEGLSKAPLLDDIADIALHAKHPMAASKTIDIDDLAGDPWITWQAGSICHDWLLHTLRSRGHEPLVAHTASEHATQLALVAAGLGACVIPRLGREPVLPGVRVLAVKPTLRRHVYALWRAENTRRNAIRVTVDAFRASASSLLAGEAPTTSKRLMRRPRGSRSNSRNR